ncbi:vitelline membrane outer layer protein 1-like [Bradysia coprophila]|uniref:vitelline membrane outer layer protein 1-like n=1 Tax=Bradysia coprophila TaxID=38358 RepID=UPI00187D8887|nr:vitelline membrane outer layer protein 1-like [Bradysia coprophila]
MAIKKLLFIFALIQIGKVSNASVRQIGRWIESPRLTNWGDWKAEQMCPPNSWVSAMNLKIEPNQGEGDDSALNGIRLTCTSMDGRDTADITSGEGPWGFYRGKKFCSSGFATGFQLRSEPDLGSGDDGAASDLMLVCANVDGTTSKVVGGGVLTFGHYTAQQMCPRDTAMCGIRTQIEREQGKGDDSALNNVDFACCPYALDLSVYVRRPAM